jgi:5-methylcytosine-specific restriction endonuclease McrA
LDEALQNYIEYLRSVDPRYEDYEFDVVKMKWKRLKPAAKKQYEPKSNIEDKTKCKLCGKPSKVRGYCEACYSRGRRNGSIPKKTGHVKNERYLKKEEFKKVKEYILDRDNYKCVQCGSVYRIQVHHIKEMAEGGSNNANNLITLCYHCHMKKHEGEPVYKLMQKAL